MSEKQKETQDSKIKLAQAMEQNLLRSAMMVTKHSNELPSNNDWEYCQSFPLFVKTMNQFGERMTHLMTKIYNHYGLTGKVGKLDFEEQLELVSDSNDVLMERINMSLDEAAGLKKQAETVMVEMMAKTSNLNGSWNRHPSSSPSTPYRLLSAKNISRPQLKFKEKICNKPVAFVPKIKEKPHSLKPLAILLELNDFGEEEYSHPYEFELEHFTPNQKLLEVPSTATPFIDVNNTPLVMVETGDSLKAMLEDLMTHTEIAVDLEAHSYRTFQGLTCLMQISTSSTDYIVDTLELWGNLQCLNEVFCNPNIVKIFHGADKDVEWLQRDFGLYLVNLFDTYQAAKLLNFPSLSLAYLLHYYCKVVVNKQFQLADWRIRPLPQEMVNYAREDTHYLGFVYQKLKQDLLAKGIGNNLVVQVWTNSRLTCLKKYRIAQIRPDSHMEIYRQSKKLFNDRQLFALKELFAWRDKVARQEDESCGFVLPKHMMLQIANVLPREMQGIIACCSPVPPLVKQHLLTLHHIILKAREMTLSLTKNEGEPLVAAKPILALDQDTEDPLHCVHDLTFSQDVRDDLPTLISPSSGQAFISQSENEASRVCIIVKTVPQARLFIDTVNNADDKKIQVAFTTPYMKYTQAKQLLQKEKSSQDRIEKIRQLFMDTVRSSPNENQSDAVQADDVKEEKEATTEGVAKRADEENVVAKKKRPLSDQLPKMKRKRPKKTTTAVAIPENAPTTATATGDPSSVAVESLPPRSGPSKKMLRKENAANQMEETSASFTPFDYSQVDYHAFQRRAAKKVVRPNGGRGRGRSRSRLERKSGQKSMTYTSKSQ